MEDRPAYKKLMDFQADLERRAALLRGREKEFVSELAVKEKDFPEAAIQGEAKMAQEKIDNLASELGTVRRELAALENPPVGGHLGTLVKDAWQEATDIITGDLRGEWDGLAARAESLKEAFLAVVAEMGSIKRRADSVSSRIAEALLSLPGPKLAVPSLTTGISERNKTGIIYINPQESERAFKKGV